MTVRLPALGELRRIAADFRLDLADTELEVFRGLMEGVFESYARIDELVEPGLAVKYPRSMGNRPSADDNPWNAWYWRCSIDGAPTGKLAGKRIAVKDNVCVAGVPMMNGSSVLEGYVPEIDATIVTRILDSGGEIIGKAVCEHLCFSGASHTSDTGPVRNPADPSRSAGGSSSGSAALLAGGAADLAIGGDQGGSIRIPAAWCGVVGHKPTYGLVPYTGVFPIEMTLDHVGPMATTVADAALLLEAIAGADGLDPRQPGDVPTDAYTAALTGDIRDIRVGILKEGFAWPGVSEPEIDAQVWNAAESLTGLAGDVAEVSIPMHRDGIHLWNAIAIEGATTLMITGNGMGTNWKGHYTTSLLDFFGRSRITRANEFSLTVKMTALVGQYMQDSYQGRYYARAQNLARSLGDAYDAALLDVDVLLMPTVPMKATQIPPQDAGVVESMSRTLEMVPNTCPFDVTGHPALTVPCGHIDGLPLGMMIVGRPWDDATVLRVGDAYERCR